MAEEMTASTEKPRRLTFAEVNQRWGGCLGDFFSGFQNKVERVLEDGKDWRPKEGKAELPEFTVFKPKVGFLTRLEAVLGRVQLIGLSFKEGHSGFDLICELERVNGGYRAKIIEGSFPEGNYATAGSVDVNVANIIPSHVDEIFTHWFLLPAAPHSSSGTGQS